MSTIAGVVQGRGRTIPTPLSPLALSPGSLVLFFDAGGSGTVQFGYVLPIAPGRPREARTEGQIEDDAGRVASLGSVEKTAYSEDGEEQGEECEEREFHGSEVPHGTMGAYGNG